jgi:phosphate transport system substrate-binding protein
LLLMSAQFTRRIVVAGLGTLPFIASPSAQTTDLSGKLTITGSSSVAPLILEVAKAFEKLNPRVRVDVQTGGSSRGIADARRGLADIGMASRDLTTVERSELEQHLLARDGICLIVHARNTVAELTEQQISDIFTGKVADWAEVGGTRGRVTVINKAEGRSTLETFLSHFNLKNSDVKASVVIGDNAQGIKTIVGNPGGIAYVSIGAAEFEVQQKTPLKMLPLRGVIPTTASVANGTFPLSRALILATKGTPSGLAREFIAYATSPKVHNLVKEQFLVPLSI